MNSQSLNRRSAALHALPGREVQTFRSNGSVRRHASTRVPLGPLLSGAALQ